jgi:glycosyltransferase involved in cell wall biosynthesis
MNVLLVQGTSAGGVGRHVVATAAGLQRRGHRVLLAAPAAAHDDFGVQATGAGFVAVAIGDRPDPRRDGAAVRRLRQICAGADVVHAHGLRAGALTALALIGRRTPLVVTLHNLPVGSVRVRAISTGLELVVARQADAVLGVSGDLVARMARRGAARTERALVPAPPGRPASGSRQQLAARLRSDLGLTPGTLLVVTVARVAVQKGLPLWLDAVAELTGHRGADLAVLIAGDGPLRADLTERARRQGLPVHLLGVRSDVSDLFTAADIAVCPSVWEGQPLVVQEALRAGAPLVATDVGGTREVAGEAAVLVPYGDPAALAAAVGRLAGDAAERARLRVAALARARELPDDEATLDQLERVYAAVRRERRAG